MCGAVGRVDFFPPGTGAVAPVVVPGDPLEIVTGPFAAVWGPFAVVVVVVVVLVTNTRYTVLLTTTRPQSNPAVPLSPLPGRATVPRPGTEIVPFVAVTGMGAVLVVPVTGTGPDPVPLVTGTGIVPVAPVTVAGAVPAAVAGVVAPSGGTVTVAGPPIRYPS